MPFGKESAYAVFNEGDQATANNILDGTWPARGYALPYLGWPLTWTAKPLRRKRYYWRFYFYGMQPLSSLLYEWQSTASSVYLSALISILRSYVAYDDTRPLNTNTFDNDHASAYRTMTLINIYFKLKRDGVLPADLDAGLTSVAETRNVPRRPFPLRGRLQPRFQRRRRSASCRQLSRLAPVTRMAHTRHQPSSADAHQHD